MTKAILKFHKIDLKNFRPYIDDHVEFSQDEKKLITIVEGKNSTGKTTLVHAINWCLYGKEDITDQNEGKPRCNKPAMYSLKIDDSFDTEVIVTFADEDGPKYIITRRITASRWSDDNSEKNDPIAGGIVPNGINFFPSLQFSERKKDGSWDTVDSDAVFTSRIEKLMPQSISEFIIFNGEELDNFFKIDSTTKIKKGIEKVSGLPVLESAINHCESMEKAYYRKKAKASGTSADIKHTEIVAMKAALQKKKKTLEILEKNYGEILENEKILEVEREKYPEKALEELERHLEDEKRHKKEYDDFLQQIAGQKREYLAGKFSYVLCHDLIKNAQKILVESELKGETPPAVQDYYVHSLIEKKKCMCGNDLSKDKEGLKKLTVLEDELSGSQIADIASEGKNTLHALLNGESFEDISEKLKKLSKDENRYKSAYGESRDAVDGLIKQLEGFDKAAIRKNISALAKLRVTKGQLDRDIPYQTSTNTAEEIKIKDKELELDELEGETKANKKWRLLHQLANMAKTDLLTIKYELIHDIRENVRKTCEEIFIKIIARGSEIKKLSITDKYQMRVLDQYEGNIIGTLSAGQYLFLSLAYIAAVREITDTNYPMIIDSPFGKIDGEQRVMIAETLPVYLPQTQMTLFVTNTEIDAVIEKDTETGKRIPPVREVWEKEKRIGRTWLLKIIKQKELTEIEEIKN